jgi:hypothetical protein
MGSEEAQFTFICCLVVSFLVPLFGQGVDKTNLKTILVEKSQQESGGALLLSFAQF